jgi:hypothetical protein
MKDGSALWPEQNGYVDDDNGIQWNVQECMSWNPQRFKPYRVPTADPFIPSPVEMNESDLFFIAHVDHPSILSAENCIRI